MKRISTLRRKLFRPAWKTRLAMRKLLKRGAPIAHSEEILAWLNAPPVGREWPNGEAPTAPMDMLEASALPPPPGSDSWLDYAVKHLDTRELNLMSLLDASIWGGDVPREAFLEAAQHELRALRMAAAGAVTESVLMTDQEFSELLNKLHQLGLRDGDIGYLYWHNVTKDLKAMRKACIGNALNVQPAQRAGGAKGDASDGEEGARLLRP